MALSWTPYDTPFGRGWIGVDESGVIRRSRLPGTADHEPVARSGEAGDLADALEAYFTGAGPLPEGEPFIDRASRTALDRYIFEAVVAIPPGSTLTYTEVAELVGRPGAARAVGAAMAHNPLAPMIPCHRVVGSDGSLRGYAGGISMKRALLDMEQSRD